VKYSKTWTKVALVASSLMFSSAQAIPDNHPLQNTPQTSPEVKVTAPVLPVVKKATIRDAVKLGVRFQKVLETLRDNHVNPENVPDTEKMFEIAVNAILKEIGDKHGAYFTPKKLEVFKEHMSPKSYSGIGIQIMPTEEGLVIGEIFDESQLTMMGIRTGDTIVAGGSPGEKMVKWKYTDKEHNAAELVGAIKGPVGTPVNLRIKRGYSDLGIITVNRVKTTNQVVFMKLDDAGILNIRIKSFTVTLANEIFRRMKDLDIVEGNNKIGYSTNSKVKGVIIDLRENGGGALGSAVNLTDMFMAANKIAVRTVERVRDGTRNTKDYKTAYPHLFDMDIPRVVLVNGRSASASEVFAGAMQAHSEMVVFGTKSYGKGSVQRIFPVTDGAGIKTTIAYYLAGGTMKIDGIGVIPDNVIEQPEALGFNEGDRAFNEHLIRISMDPNADHQLNVAHAYLLSFVNGTFHLISSNSVNMAVEASKATTTKLTKKLCKEMNLKACNSILGKSVRDASDAVFDF
jgi:carboxyl-terminal processing protease